MGRSLRDFQKPIVIKEGRRIGKTVMSLIHSDPRFQDIVTEDERLYYSSYKEQEALFKMKVQYPLTTKEAFMPRSYREEELLLL